MQALISESELEAAERILVMVPMVPEEFVYHGPLLGSIKDRYPHLEIDLWYDSCRSGTRQSQRQSSLDLSEWLETCEFIDVVFPCARSSSDRLRLIRTAQKRRYDIIVYMELSRTKDFARVARQIAPDALKVGNYPDKLLGRFIDLKTYRAIERKFVMKSEGAYAIDNLHTSDVLTFNYQSCFGELNVRSEHVFGLPVDLLEEHGSAVEKFLGQYAIGTDELLIVIDPFAVSSRRSLEPTVVVELVNSLLDAFSNIRIVLCVSAEDQTGLNAVFKSVSDDVNSNITYFIANDRIFEVSALLGKAHFVISVETLTMHFASVLGKPQYVIARESKHNLLPHRYNGVYMCDTSLQELTHRQLYPQVSQCLQTIL